MKYGSCHVFLLKMQTILTQGSLKEEKIVKYTHFLNIIVWNTTPQRIE